MKSIRILLWLCAICLLTTSVASAQNGAVVVKGEDIWGLWDWNGELVVALESSDSEGFCGDDLGDLMWADWMDVWRPDGSLKYHDRGHYFTRVFYPATPPDDTIDAWCALWNDGPLVAEGITHSTFNDNDANVGHPNRRNTWGYNVAGTLYDYAGFCGDGMVELNTVVRLMLKKDRPACEPDCLIVKQKGPRLNCPD